MNQPKPPKSHAKNAKKVRTLNAQDFIQQFMAKQSELLIGMAQAIRNGEIQLNNTNADTVCENIIRAWCEESEPSVDLHMQMISACFLWALQDEVYAEEFPEESEVSEVVNNDRTTQITMEVLKTIQAIWGKR